MSAERSGLRLKCGLCWATVFPNIFDLPRGTIYLERLADGRNLVTFNGDTVHECAEDAERHGTDGFLVTTLAGAPAENPLLTADEREALALTAQLAHLFGRIVGWRRSRSGDLNEAVTLIHGLQHMLMAQAAARAYPTEYRRMGEGLPDMEEPAPPAWNDLS